MSRNRRGEGCPTLSAILLVQGLSRPYFSRMFFSWRRESLFAGVEISRGEAHQSPSQGYADQNRGDSNQQASNYEARHLLALNSFLTWKLTNQTHTRLTEHFFNPSDWEFRNPTWKVRARCRRTSMGRALLRWDTNPSRKASLQS